MGQQDQILDWMQKHSAVFHLKTMFPSGFGEWLSGYHDCKVGLSLEDRAYLGQGTSRTQQGALWEAIQDATQKLFRSRVQNLKQDSLGVGPSLDEAALAARLQVVERDAFLCHYLTQTPFYPISLSGFEQLPSFLTESTIKLSSQGVRFEIREMRRIHDAYSVVALAIGVRSPKPFGAIVGIASDVSYFNAIEKAVLRCLRKVIPVLEGKAPSSELAPESLDPVFVKVMSDYLRLPNETQLKQWADHFVELADITVEKVNKLELLPEFAVAPLEFVRASSEGFQPFFSGPLTTQNVSLERLARFTGHAVELGDLQQYPQPLK